MASVIPSDGTEVTDEVATADVADNNNNFKAQDVNAPQSYYKEEKTEDSTTHTSNQANTNDTNATSAVDGDSWDPLTTVDSALLSALLDPRERKALLRLERALTDFINSSLHFIEVGGAFNAIVLGENEGVDRGYSLEECMSPQNVQEFQFQQSRGLRQTSFQRLTLHRLADRFGIVREVIPQNENIVTSLNLIRLIKTEESRVPDHMVGEVDLGLLVGWKNPLARENRSSNYNNNNGGYGTNNGGGFNTLWSPNGDQELHQLSDHMGSSSLNNPPAAQPQPSKKMVIMKRSSTSGSNNNDSKGKKEGKSRNRKKLVDKEKAYEEARARIFGVEKKEGDKATSCVAGENVEAGVDENHNGSDRSAECMDGCQDGNVDQTIVENPEKKQLNPQVMEFKPLSSLEESQHSTTSVVTGDEQIEAGEDCESEEGDQNNTAAESKEKIITEESSNTKQNKKANKTKSSGKTSPSSNNNNKSTGKAVYRNRQQEEADPDFKRRSGPSYYTPQYSHNPYAPNIYNNMVNVSMCGQTMGQHPNMMAGQHPGYYGQQQFYPNHLTSPQSPAFYGHQGGYPVTQNKAAPSAPQDNARPASAVDGNKQKESGSKTQQTKPQVLQKAPGGCGTKVAALRPEDFPALR
ncbi:hypothetical protein ACHAXN_003919 [Cyclotella atomus]